MTIQIPFLFHGEYFQFLALSQLLADKFSLASHNQVFMNFIYFRVHQKPVPEALEEMEDQALLAIKEANV